jgi:hypothetical protein
MPLGASGKVFAAARLLCMTKNFCAPAPMTISLLQEDYFPRERKQEDGSERAKKIVTKHTLHSSPNPFAPEGAEGMGSCGESASGQPSVARVDAANCEMVSSAHGT